MSRSTAVRWFCLCLSVCAFAMACSDPPKAGPAGTSVACKVDSDCPGTTSVCNVAKSTCYTKGCDALCPTGQSCDPVAKKCVLFGNGGVDANGTKDGVVSDTVDADVPDGGSMPDADPGTEPDGGLPGTDADSPTDIAVSGPDKSCGKCSVDVDCGDGFQCIPLLSGNFCARKCGTGADCLPGYKCEQASSDPKNKQTYCVLPTFDCLGCAGDPKGCPAGQKCNVKVGTPTCVAVKAQCEACNQDVDCDNGLRCVKQGDTKVCAPDCSGGKTCPANSTCQTFYGIPACAFKAEKCCFGAGCTVSTACKGCDESKCLGGECVECVKDADCPGGTCNVAVHACVKEQDCVGDKPIKWAQTGECVECANNTHCATNAKGTTCDPASHTCGKATSVSECAACGGNYPGCVEINGTWACVECTSDKECADKKKGTCDGKNYTCSGTVAVGGGPEKGTCTSDADCVNGPSTTFTLKCDPLPGGTGLCYDTEGKCDNLVAFCNAAKGSDCSTGGAGLGIPLPPGFPGGGAGGGGGVCTCPIGSSTGSPGPSGTCQIAMLLVPSLKNCDCAKDPTAAVCQFFDLGAGKQVGCCDAATSTGGAGNPLSQLACLFGSKSAPPSDACFGGACSDSGCLGALLGGGSSTSTGKGTCGTGGGLP